MKNGKKPTRKQVGFIQKKGLNAENWLVVKDCPDRMVIRHKHFDRNVRVLRREQYEQEDEPVTVCPCCRQERKRRRNTDG